MKTPEEAPGDSELGALTHIDGAGRARMVDVTSKPWTHRRALARCRVAFGGAQATQAGAVRSPVAESVEGTLSEVLVAAKLAGIQAAKQTARLIPLCHPLAVSLVDVRLWVGGDSVTIEGEAQTTGPTGVEMEALTACAVAALTIVSAVRSVRSDVSVEDLALWQKSGGRSGTWVRGS